MLVTAFLGPSYAVEGPRGSCSPGRAATLVLHGPRRTRSFRRPARNPQALGPNGSPHRPAVRDVPAASSRSRAGRNPADGRRRRCNAICRRPSAAHRRRAVRRPFDRERRRRVPRGPRLLRRPPGRDTAAPTHTRDDGRSRKGRILRDARPGRFHQHPSARFVEGTRNRPVFALKIRPVSVPTYRSIRSRDGDYF